MQQKILPWVETLKEKFHWEFLSFSTVDMNILEENQDKITWYRLCQNRHAIPLLEKNKDKIDWTYLSCNINAIYLLERNLDKIEPPKQIDILRLNHMDKNIERLYNTTFEVQ